MNAPTHHPPAVRTTCPYCGVGCGVLAHPDGQGGATVAGDPSHPANFGRLCSKGSALGETLGLSGRLLHPMARGKDGGLARIGWSDALDRVAEGFKRIAERDGPDAVAFYLSGQLLTEDYYVANKLMKGFVGSANVDTNSRLCMASSVAGHRRAFGSDTVPGTYEDLDEADLVILVGSNAAWCHPVLYQRLVKNRRERGAKIVVIDPRRTATVEDADLFLPIAPGKDTTLFCGLLVHLADTQSLDFRYIDSHTNGFENALARARDIAPSLAAIVNATRLRKSAISQFFDLFRNTPRVVTCFSQGVNQSAQGTDKVNAIINCHLATGRIGVPGAGPFSLTGQPNAMGGREVGGLANQLAAHMGFAPDEIDRVGRFWEAPSMVTGEGRKAVQMFEAVENGTIKALWVMGTNPAVSLPRARAMRKALDKLELFVVSENVLSNDTVNAGAHILLPAAAWGEKDGTVTNSERRISRQRPFLSAPGEARPDWWIVSEVARRMGFGQAFRYRTVADIFREHARLSGFENNGQRDFDIGALATLSDEAFDALAPVQWPAPVDHGARRSRFFANGIFYTPDRKARFIAPERPALHAKRSPNFPFHLNTGRVRDQWHTMTRTGASPKLGVHRPEPFVEIHPADAEAAGLTDNGFARVSTEHGSCVLKVNVSDGQQPGSLFVPIHWSDVTASSARVGDLVAPATDPFSGQPEAKATPAAIAPMTFNGRGFALTRQSHHDLPAGTWWARVAMTGGCGLLIATNDKPHVWRSHAPHLFGPECELAEYVDEQRGAYRVAAFLRGRLEGCLFIGPADAAPQWDTVKALFESEALSEHERRVLISGRPADGVRVNGPIVCTCFGVGLTAIREVLASRAATSVEGIGEILRAGTNCGSCLPELKKVVALERSEAPAEAPASASVTGAAGGEARARRLGHLVMQLLSKSRFAKAQVEFDATSAELLVDLTEQYRVPAGDPVVVVGGGPSGLRAAQELLRHGQPVVLLNAERWRPYNRIKLTPFLAGEVQIGLVYQSNVFPENAPITQYNGHRVVRIDRAAKTVENQFGRRWRYSHLVLCLGSRAHIPPIPGRELPGVFSFRNFDDVEQLVARSVRSRCTVVIGGGLLGLEAARGMALRNIKTVVIEHENRLMARQIDSGAGEVLAEKIRAMGLEVRTGCSVKTIAGTGRVESIVLSTGETIACDTAIICTGIRSNIELARDAGIAVGHGITVNDAMQTSDPSIYAVGECAEHDGHVYGLVSPGLDQAAVAAARIAGIAADYRGSVPTTKLKVVGTDVFSMGDIEQLDQRTDVSTLVWQDAAAGSYRRLVLRRGRLVGAFGVGSWPEVSRIQQAVRDRSAIWPWQMWRFSRTGLLFGAAQPNSVAAWPVAATVCNCTGVTRGRLGESIQSGAATLELLSRDTGACTVCGTCRPLLIELLGGAPKYEAVFGKRTIATASLLAACIALAAVLLPAWPYSTSIERGIGLDALWIDGTWKQVTGFTLVGLSAIVAFLSIRKRLSWRWLGSYRGWRIVHAAVGAAVLGVLFLHTGFHLGQNLNRWLMLTFIAVIAAGCVTGIATAREHRVLAKGAKSWRNAFTWTHILAFWPLPLLLFVHIVTVYAY